MPRATHYWLMKSEPSAYSIDDLASEKNKTTHWDGVRNYQARNMMRDDMKKGDLVLFYHSNAKPSPGVAGIAKVVKESYPDFTALDKKSKYFDEKSSSDNPRWFMVDIKFQKKFKQLVTLDDLREIKALNEMVLLRKGSRLSIQPVTKAEFDKVIEIASSR